MRENKEMEENPYQSPRARSVADRVSAAANSETDERAARHMKRTFCVLIVAYVPFACFAIYLGPAAALGALFGFLVGSALTIFLYRRKRRKGP